MASVNPNDRDRGLRLVGIVTSAVAAVSLLAVGATTALAAGATRHKDQLRSVSANSTQPAPAPTGSPASLAPADTVATGSTGAGTVTGSPASNPGPTRKSATAKRKSRSVTAPVMSPTGRPVSHTAVTSPAAAPTGRPSTTTAKPKPKPTAPATTSSTSAAPTPVPSTSS